MRVSIPHLLSICKKLAVESGSVIRRIHASGSLGVVVKSQDFGVNDYVTQADIQAQQVILSGLYKNFPSLRVIAEESDHDLSNNDTILTAKYNTIKSLEDVPIQDISVWVDPLDATREYTKGTHLQCVFSLIGISILGNPIAGVMHQPFFDSEGRTINISGMVGGMVEGLRAETRQHKTTETELIITTSASHHTAKNDEAVMALHPTEVIRVGGAAYKASLVMENKADIYLYNAGGCKLWDTCAPHAILRALGGDMSTADGKPIIYSRENLQVPSLIASLQNYERYVKIIEDTNKTKS